MGGFLYFCLVPLAAPAFAYTFPLVKAAIKAHMLDHEVLIEGLEIISEHTALRYAGSFGF